MKKVYTLTLALILISITAVLQATNIGTYPPELTNTKTHLNDLTNKIVDLQTLAPIESSIYPFPLKETSTMTFDNPQNKPLSIVFTNESGKVIKKVFTNGIHTELKREDFNKGEVNYQIYQGKSSIGNGNLIIR